jgi:hypothetical protein
METADSPEVVIAKRLLDHVKLSGFTFQRTAPGEDGPLVGHRVSDDWVDLIHIEGFSRDCFAWRKRISSLIVPRTYSCNVGWRAVRSMCSTRC